MQNKVDRLVRQSVPWRCADNCEQYICDERAERHCVGHRLEKEEQDKQGTSAAQNQASAEREHAALRARMGLGVCCSLLLHPL